MSWLRILTRMGRPRRKKPIPAALAVTRGIGLQGNTVRTFEQPLFEQLAPTDDLRLRLVRDNREVIEALELVRSVHARMMNTLEHAGSSAEAAAAHARWGQVHESAVRDSLEPAILRAEARRQRLLSAVPPDHARLVGALGLEISADRILAVENLLRRNPHWRDPELWTAPDTVRYLARAVNSEALFIAWRFARGNALLRRGKLGPKKQGVQPVRSFRSPAEAPMLRREAAASRIEGTRRGLKLLRQLTLTLPAQQLRIVAEMTQRGCGPYAAAGRLGIARSAADALLQRAARLAKKQQSVTRRAL